MKQAVVNGLESYVATTTRMIIFLKRLLLLASILSVEFLDLSDNSIEGALPRTEFANFSRLVHLDLSKNELTGAITQELFKLTSLRYLAFYGDSLQGRLPAEIGNFTNLRALTLGNN
ncbi:hypothetical protein Leryth_010858 [Lithospermum erythrorhizon]|nr:hypothetical protein Leryth_010858 [Lithospermum erythrorhizon]